MAIDPKVLKQMRKFMEKGLSESEALEAVTEMNRLTGRISDGFKKKEFNTVNVLGTTKKSKM